MWQAEHVAESLHDHGHRTTLVPLVSRGDIDLRPMDVAMPGETRTIGVFTKRIQQAVLEHQADVAVHSLKDLPTAEMEALTLAAVPVRGDVRDALVSSDRYTLKTLPRGGVVGTGSKRRAAQLLNRRPDLRLMPIRGNVQTRLAKLENGDYNAIVLAEAGIERLAMHDLGRTVLSIDEMLPAPGQGALAIEVRAGDHRCVEAIQSLDDFRTHAEVVAERTLLSLLDGGCLAPIAALGRFGQPSANTLTLTAMVLSPDGRDRIDQVDCEPVHSLEAAVKLGRRVANAMIDRGAAKLLTRGNAAS